MTNNDELNVSGDIGSEAKPHWLELLNNPGGVAILAEELSTSLPADKVAEYGSQERRIWEQIGAYYRERSLWYDAIAIYAAMYEHFLHLQLDSKIRIDKGMPLVWIADCYAQLGNVTLSKRYLMLTLIEDSIRDKGSLDPLKVGSYFRLAWRHGLPDIEIKRYASRASEIALNDPDLAIFPEYVLQELDKNWLIEIPSANESSIYVANTIYIQYLINKLGDTTGSTLEKLADYLLSCIPGCRTARRQRSPSTDYDVVCSLQGPSVDFRSEFGRYFVCECKDWQIPADFTAFAKFASVLDSIKAGFGIIFSKQGISGQGKGTNADRQQLKSFQSSGTIIIVIDLEDLNYVSAGGNFISILRQKYERVRLDLLGLQPISDDI